MPVHCAQPDQLAACFHAGTASLQHGRWDLTSFVAYQAHVLNGTYVSKGCSENLHLQARRLRFAAAWPTPTSRPIDFRRCKADRQAAKVFKDVLEYAETLFSSGEGQGRAVAQLVSYRR